MMFHEVKSAETHPPTRLASFLKTWLMQAASTGLEATSVNPYSQTITIRRFSRNFKQGQLSAILGEDSGGLPLKRTSVNKYLRGHYLHRHKGKSLRRGHGPACNIIWWEKRIDIAIPSDFSPGDTITVRTDETLELKTSFKINHAEVAAIDCSATYP